MAEQITDPKILAMLNSSDTPYDVPGGNATTKSKGTLITDPEILAQLNSDVHPDDGGVIHSLRQAIHAPTRILENGVLLGLGDRARALMDAALGNGDYSGNLANEQAQTDQFKSDHPIAAPVIEGVGGAVAPAGALGAASKGVSLGGKALRGALTGAGFGAVTGATNSKDFTDLPQTAKDAGIGAVLGGAIGGGMPMVGSAVGNVATKVANAVRSTPGISRAAANPLLDALKAQGPQATADALDRLGPEATLADTGPAMLGRAQGVALTSDEARNTMANTLTTRNLGTDARVQADVDAALGPAEDPQDVTDAIIAHRKATDRVNYPAALDNAPDVKIAPILTQLDAEIPSAVGSEKTALKSVRDMLMTTEKQPVVDAAGIQQYDRLGNPKFQDVPVSQNDANVLHKVKGQIDSVINYGAPGLGVEAGAVARQQGALKYFRNQINDALESQVPGYAEANAASSALAKRAEAVDAGTQYMGSAKTTPSPARFADQFSQLSPGEQIALAKGSRGNIDRVLGTKSNDLEALKSELQGEGGWNTAKMATVHGQDAVDQLVGSVDRNKVFRSTYNKVVENSQTAQREAARQAMKPTPASETPLINPNMTATGLVGTAGKKIATGIVNALLKKDPTASYGEISKILTANGPEARTYLKALSDTLNRQNAGSAVAGRLGNQAALLGGATTKALVAPRRQAPKGR